MSETRDTAPAGGAPALVLERVVRTFQQAGQALEVLRGVDLTIEAGELVGLIGPSGAGKSTLLQIAGLLEKPTTGHVRVAGETCDRLGDAARTAIRRSRVGFVYQFHHLLAEFSALENVAMPMMIAGERRRDATGRANELLRQVGLAARAGHRPGRLSGGEQQRVAIARALANGPALLLADEPTGNLDPETSAGVFDMLARVVRTNGTAALIATHNLALADRMDRVVTLSGGLLQARA